MIHAPAEAAKNTSSAAEDNMSYTEHKDGNFLYHTADIFTSAGGIVHAHLTRHGGVSAGVYDSLNLNFSCDDSHENVLENYKTVCSRLGLNLEKCVLSHQVHSDSIRIATDADCGKGIFSDRDYDADALVTDIPGIPLFIFTADCVPVLLYDPAARVIAAVHAGWKGTVLDICGKTVQLMSDRFGCMPENILASIGYAIDKCCFETDSDVPDAVTSLLGSDAAPFISGSGPKYHVDLKGINRHLLVRRGLNPDNISVMSHCTMCMHDMYWSHRFTKGVRGAQASVISLI